MLEDNANLPASDGESSRQEEEKESFPMHLVLGLFCPLDDDTKERMQ